VKEALPHWNSPTHKTSRKNQLRPGCVEDGNEIVKDTVLQQKTRVSIVVVLRK